jgi:hypothetical protein
MSYRLRYMNDVVTAGRPSARALSLEWFSLGPEYIASIFVGRVIAGVGFGDTPLAAFEEAALAAAADAGSR